MDLGGRQPKAQGMRGVLCTLIAMGLGCAMLGQGVEDIERGGPVGLHLAALADYDLSPEFVRELAL